MRNTPYPPWDEATLEIWGDGTACVRVLRRVCARMSSVVRLSSPAAASARARMASSSLPCVGAVLAYPPHVPTQIPRVGNTRTPSKKKKGGGSRGGEEKNNNFFFFVKLSPTVQYCKYFFIVFKTVVTVF